MSREEVIILLTPHIIEEPSEVGGADRADDIRMKVDAAKHNLQAIDRGRIAEDAYARAAKYYLEGDIDSAVYNLKVVADDAADLSGSASSPGTDHR